MAVEGQFFLDAGEERVEIFAALWGVQMVQVVVEGVELFVKRLAMEAEMLFDLLEVGLYLAEHGLVKSFLLAVELLLVEVLFVLQSSKALLCFFLHGASTTFTLCHANRLLTRVSEINYNSSVDNTNFIT